MEKSIKQCLLSPIKIVESHDCFSFNYKIYVEWLLVLKHEQVILILCSPFATQKELINMQNRTLMESRTIFFNSLTSF